MICPLDWGLGHATRCVPIIRELLRLDCEVIIAAANATEALLRQEFPQLTFLPLSGYGIKFNSHYNITWKIVRQLPKIMSTIFKENQWLKTVLRKQKIDALISDNRPGLYNRKVISVYITHQLAIKTGNRLSSVIARYIHHYFINKFDHCWVPDFEKDGLAGELSHPVSMPPKVKYIGALSRFFSLEHTAKKYDLLIILSGPEPQRTILEKILLEELLVYKGKTLIVRGLPEKTSAQPGRQQKVSMVNHLSSERLCRAIQQASVVISRSGYTTVMDLFKLKQKAILIATPGQAEQEYLARYLKEKKIFFSTGQPGFNLIKALEDSSHFTTAAPVADMEQYKMIIGELVRRPDIAVFKETNDH